MSRNNRFSTVHPVGGSLTSRLSGRLMPHAESRERTISQRSRRYRIPPHGPLEALVRRQIGTHQSPSPNAAARNMRPYKRSAAPTSGTYAISAKARREGRSGSLKMNAAPTSIESAKHPKSLAEVKRDEGQRL